MLCQEEKIVGVRLLDYIRLRGWKSLKGAYYCVAFALGYIVV